MDKFYNQTLIKLESEIKELEIETDCSIERIEAVINPNSAIEKKEYFSILISNCVAVEKNKR